MQKETEFSVKTFGASYQSQNMLSAFVVLQNALEASSWNSIGPNQIAHIGTVVSGSTLFASLLKFVSNVSKDMQ